MADDRVTVGHVMDELEALHQLHTAHEAAHTDAATQAANRRPAPPVDGYEGEPSDG